MGGTCRILQMLLSTAPFPTPRPSASSSLRCLARSSLRAFRLPSPFLHRRLLPPLRAADHVIRALSSIPEGRVWPEWSALVEHVVASGYGGAGRDEDVFEDSIGRVPEDFANIARACLSFAHDRPMLVRSLSREDIRIVVDNVAPSLFKNCSELARRMAFFLNGEGSSVLQYEKVQTVDLLRYLLSYAHNYMICSRTHDIGDTEFVDASVRNLLKEIVNSSGCFRSQCSTDFSNKQSPSTLDQLRRTSRSDVQMKRGDWICSKCNFMNFSRNMKCLECGEARPKIQLTGGEWECPQCDFFNYGRNMSCLRCDSKRPGNSFPPTAKDTSLEYTGSDAKQFPRENGSTNRSLDRVLRKISQISSPGNSSSNHTATGRGLDNNSSGHAAIGRVSGISRQKESNYVPFAPLSPDVFRTPSDTNAAKQSSSPSSNSQTDSLGSVFSENYRSVGESPGDHKSWDPHTKATEHHDTGKSRNPTANENFSGNMPSHPQNKGENRFVVSKKKDRSFTSPEYSRRFAKEQSNDSNFVPFVPFPPGYFARKDNHPGAGSSTPKAELENTDAHFSGSTQDIVERSDDSHYSSDMSVENYSKWNRGSIESSRRYSFQDKGDPSCMSVDNSSIPYQRKKFQKNDVKNWEIRSSKGVPKSVDGSWRSSQPSIHTHKNSWSRDGSLNSYGNNQGGNQGRAADVSRGDSPNPSSWSSQVVGQNDMYPTLGNDADLKNARGTIPQAKTDKGGGGSSNWKRLEGSAVKEPDPSDMSEEAKAQRWFRRVAQISDISELAKIPDEDFPQIMPMRKGVNRFVVSKRKTAFERRLTSPEYRRNLPIVRSEPEKDCSDQGKV